MAINHPPARAFVHARKPDSPFKFSPAINAEEGSRAVGLAAEISARTEHLSPRVVFAAALMLMASVAEQVGAGDVLEDVKRTLGEAE
jgi:hypothetical protein